MIAIPKPTPVPGNWMNARTASNRAKPARIWRKQASPWLECPQAAGREKPHDSGADREPAPEPGAFERGKVAEGPEPVEAEHSQAKEQEAEPREGGKEAEDRDQDGRVLQVASPSGGTEVLLVVPHPNHPKQPDLQYRQNRSFGQAWTG